MEIRYVTECLSQRRETMIVISDESLESKSILSQRRRERQGKQQHDERQEVSRIARMEAWGKLVDCTKQLPSGISGIRGICVIRD